ncbi:sugar ABC transporter substrate-binding protein [Demequina iriomotensis]|uniref:sugar ABC transporter substrate-binding protein n=1 Tax=Demequina iriomotensis TaxID=1536641 RepID=UPI0007827988|nr:substrate-binding domain-containing protein [Demequina iriomotensis]
MKSPVLTSARRLRGMGVASALAIATLSLAACASDTDPGAETSGSSAAEPTTATSEPAAPTSALAEYMAPMDAYPLPEEPIDASSLEGKTVYYIPITQQSPQFAITGPQVTEALESVGINVQTCNGQGNPTEIGKCITQAVNADAMAIIGDAISYAMVSQAYDDARAAGIPVIVGNQKPYPEAPADETLAYVEGAGEQMSTMLLQWAGEDSGGDADILINQTADGMTPGLYMKAAIGALEGTCPGCTTTINEVTSASFDLVPSSTSAALLKDPDVDYVVAQFAQFLQPTQQGITTAGKTTDVTLMTGSAQLGALQALQGGSLQVAAGQASAFHGWVYADASMRLALGLELPEYTIPVRLFTADSMADVDLSEEGETSGSWYGPTTFKDDFKALWGAA